MRLLLWLLGPAAAGPVVGVAWWLLAPTAPVRVLGGTDDGSPPVLVAEGLPELDAAQDGTLLLLGLGAGLVTGAVVALRCGARPTSATLLAGLGALAGSGLAAWVGSALGPDPVAAQGASPVSPLAVHAPGVLLVWPVVALVVATGGHIGAVRSERSESSAEP